MGRPQAPTNYSRSPPGKCLTWRRHADGKSCLASLPRSNNCVPVRFPPAWDGEVLARHKARSRNNLPVVRVLLSNGFSKFRQRELCGAMSKQTKRSPDRLDWDIRAADALELARLMPPGPERNEALKLASLLRCTADARGLIFAKRGRPRK